MVLTDKQVTIKIVNKNQPFIDEWNNVNKWQTILCEHGIETKAYTLRYMGHSYPQLSYNIERKHFFGLITTHPEGFIVYGSGGIHVYEKETIDIAKKVASILGMTEVTIGNGCY